MSVPPPPLTAPETLPVVNLNASVDVPPVSLAIPVKAMPLTLPAFAPVMVQILAMLAPWSVSAVPKPVTVVAVPWVAARMNVSAPRCRR